MNPKQFDIDVVDFMLTIADCIDAGEVYVRSVKTPDITRELHPSSDMHFTWCPEFEFHVVGPGAQKIIEGLMGVHEKQEKRKAQQNCFHEFRHGYECVRCGASKRSVDVQRKDG